MNSKLDLQKFGIDPAVTTLPKNIDPAVKNVIKKIGKVNNTIVDILDEEEKAYEEMRKLREEIKQRTAKLTARLKEIRLDQKARNEQKLLLLGEREAYKKDFIELGGRFKSNNFSLVAKQTAIGSKELVEA